MAADRRVTSEDGSSGSLVKIAKSGWLIAAACGNAVSTLDVRRAVRKGAMRPEDIIEHVDKDSTALVLLPNGDIHKVESGRVWPAERGLVGIGSGSDLAVGYLTGLGSSGHVWDVRAALKFVASRRTDCGGGVDFRHF